MTDDSEQQTSLISAPKYLLDSLEEPFDKKTKYHVGIDIGLLVLRVAVGGTMLLQGLFKFGLFGGPGIDAVPAMLQHMGITSATSVLSWVLALTEVIGGSALVVGLLTPLAAASALGVTATATWLMHTGGYFPSMHPDGSQSGGYYFAVLTGAGALALLFTGPGRLAADFPAPWRRNPVGAGLLGAILAAGGTLLVVWLFT